MSEIITFAPTTAGDGTEFVVPFPYLEESHVKLYVNGVEDTNKTFPSDGCVKASVAITAGDIVVVKRETPRSALITTLANTGTLSSDDMNHQSLQAVYVATEAADGLREGLALDEATESYWEGAPTGSNRTLKNLVDPSAAQEAATKGWYDTQLSTHASNAATSASNTATSASTAVTQSASAVSSSSTAVAQADAATDSATAAAASEATAAAADNDHAAEAEAWANTAVSTEVTYDNNGGVNDNPSYSAKHWAAQAEPAATTATAANATAQAIAAAATPLLSSFLLGEEAGIAINYLGDNVSSNDFTGTKEKKRDIPISYYSETIHGSAMVGGNDYCRFNGMRYQERTAEFRTTSYNDADGTPIGFYLTGADDPRSNWAAQPGVGTFGGQGTVGLTDSTSLAYGPGYSIVNSRSPTRLLIDSSTGLHYTWSNVGFNASTDPVAGEPLSVTVVVGDSNNYGTWPDLYMEFYHDGDNIYHRARIELDNETTTAHENILSVRKTVMYPGAGWIRYDFLIAPHSTDATYNLSTLRLYMCQSDSTTNFTGDGTSYSYIGWFGMNRGHHKVPLHDAPQSSLTGVAQFGIGSIWNTYDGWSNLNHAPYEQWDYQTYWGQMYLNHKWATWDQGTRKPFSGVSGYTGTREMTMNRNSSTGNAELYSNWSATYSSETWDSGLNIPLDDTDNGGLGTKLSYVWRLREQVHTLWIRINDGAIQKSATDYTMTMDDWDQGVNGYQPSAWLATSNLSSGMYLRFKGFIARAIGDDEVNRYFYF